MVFIPFYIGQPIFDEDRYQALTAQLTALLESGPFQGAGRNLLQEILIYEKTCLDYEPLCWTDAVRPRWASLQFCQASQARGLRASGVLLQRYARQGGAIL